MRRLILTLRRRSMTISILNIILMRSIALYSIYSTINFQLKSKKRIKITSIWIVSVLISIIFIKVTQIIQKKLKTRKNKWNQFECGFSLITPSHIPFSFQFFMIALLFLIFDVEISAILAYPLETKVTKTKMYMITFLIVLTIGLIYEWQKRKLDWSKWMVKIIFAKFKS